MPRKKKTIEEESKEPENDNKIINLYKFMPADLKPKYSNPNYEKHLINLPFRMLIVGASGSCKSVVACDLIRRMNNTFGNIKIITKAQEPLYDFLKRKIPASHLQVTEGITTTPDLNDFEEDDEMKDLQHLVIFDDLVLEDKNLQKRLISPYFIRGRKIAKGINTVYITQSYYEVPSSIRKNLTHIILKKLSNNRDLLSILREYNLGIPKEQLLQLYQEATRDNESFLMIDLNAPTEKRFRKNYLDVVDMTAETGMPVDIPIGGKLSKKKNIETYGRVLEHLVSHIKDPTEPIDNRDYRQASSLINVIKELKHK